MQAASRGAHKAPPLLFNVCCLFLQEFVMVSPFQLAATAQRETLTTTELYSEGSYTEVGFNGIFIGRE